jgi:prepilin-type N-terminal cleavage/methylation domain-containing protein
MSNRINPFINKDDGFTLMEVVVSISVILVISGCIFTAFSVSLKTISRAGQTADTALELLRIDIFIRRETEKFHIPYWADPLEETGKFIDSLLRSSYGRYIGATELLKSNSGITRGIRVFYTVRNTTAHTDALFPSTPVLERLR